MASRIYPKLYELFNAGTLSWTGDTIQALLVNASASYDRTHDFVNDVTANELSDATRITLASKTAADNGTDRWIWDAGDLTFAAQTASQTVEACIIYKFITDDASSPALVYVDGTNITTNGSNVIVTFAAGGVFDITY